MVALHETVIDGDVMAMRRVTDGVAIPASHTLARISHAGGGSVAST